jgi:hypothetical protein
MWEANGQASEVALYVRSLKDAEKPRASTASRTLVRQQMDALGITVPGLRANRWVIVDDIVAPAELAQTGTDGPSAKARLKLLEGGA